MSESDLALRIDTATGREASIGALLAASFVNTPSVLLRQLTPARRFQVMRTVLTAATREAARNGKALVAVGDPGDQSIGIARTGDSTERPLGALLLMPPRSFPAGRRRKARGAPAALRTVCLAPQLLPPWRRAFPARTARLPPIGDWWLIYILAVDPRAHRRGVGRTLLRHALGIVDDTGLPCYVHTASPAATALFRSAGFEVDGPPVVVHSSGPPYLRMTRPGCATD